MVKINNIRFLITKRDLEVIMEYYNLAGKILCYIVRPLLYIRMLPKQINIFRVETFKIIKYKIYQIVIIRLKIKIQKEAE